MSYIALYRKYRSQSFDELMGQEQVTVTLQNAIRSGKIAHAYLFYGARGCGKTSTARLLARALNCIAQDGPTAEPCGTCRLCTAIRDGACMDVLEMDAASETGIDDVREKIVENVQYAPGEARYKVYIIDEVHDLSAKAFDALLKTLEEPPAHVIFILATTEHHKVPITIRSRCMQYHFKRGTLEDLAKSICRVVEAEGFQAEAEAVQAIARGAEGSWRDALSLLEQVLAYSDGIVTAESVHRAIGSVGTETLARVTETLARGDWCATLAIAGELIDSGKDVRQLLTALSGHLRDLMLISAGALTAAERELGPDRYKLLQRQAPLFDPPTLLAMSAILAAAEREIRFTNQHRWLLESTLLRLMPVNLRAAQTPVRSVPASSEAIAPPLRRESVASTPTVVPRPHAAARHEDVVPVEDDSVSTPDLMPTPVKPIGTHVPEVVLQQSGMDQSAPEIPKSQPQAPIAPVSGSRFADDISLEVVVRAWPRILALFRKASPSGAPWLEKGEVVDLDNRIVVLSFADSFARERIQNNAKGKAKVEQVLNQGLNTEGYKIRCITRETGQSEDKSTSSVPVSPDPLGTSPATGMALLLEPPEAPAPEASAARIADFGIATERPAPPDQPAGGGFAGVGLTSVAASELSDAPGLLAAIEAAPGNSAERTAPRSHPSGAAPPKAPDPGANASEPVEGGLLAEALFLFGGTVVRSEPLKPG